MLHPPNTIGAISGIGEFRPDKHDGFIDGFVYNVCRRDFAECGLRRGGVVSPFPRFYTRAFFFPPSFRRSESVATERFRFANHVE